MESKVEAIKEKVVFAVKIMAEPLIWEHGLSNKEKRYIKDSAVLENVRRIIPMAVMIMLIGIANLALGGLVDVDELLKPLGVLGSIFMIAAAVIVIAAAVDVLTKEHKSRLRARAICMVYWASVVAGIMPFIYIDYMEKGSLTNLVLYFALCIMLPIVSLTEIIIGVGAQLVLLTFITAMGGGKPYLLIQALALALLAVYVSQIAYCNYAKSITDLKHMSDKLAEADQCRKHQLFMSDRMRDIGL